MQKKSKNELISFNSYIDSKYGKNDSEKRKKWEAGYETFKLGIIIEEARTKLGLTQEELAQKCGTNKSYISRIEHDASDIKLSTLLKIVRNGLGGDLKIVLPF